MARKTRMYLPDIPAHIVQRGNNRNACFFSDNDYYYYKQALAEGLRRYGGQLHAYCLMTNHVHLLITPSEQDSISRIIQHLGRQYVQYINKTYRRSGTLWEGRHKGSLVDAEHYLMACYRYIEMNPVAAGMVKMPGQYRWSSYSHNAWAIVDPLISPHPVYESLSVDRTKRLSLYRELFSTTPTDADLLCIRNSLAKNLPTGNSRFSDQVATTIGRKLGKGARGRPKQTD